jgi:anti-sigma regulatory factor (Ser/Thr protein kinase)
MDRTKRWSHRLALTPDPTSARKARDFVQKHLVAHDLKHLVDDVRLVVSELATNVLKHCGTSFVVELHATDARVVLTVRDDSWARPERGEAGPSATSGRGLAIVDRVSRDWGVDGAADGGKAVWAEFDVQETRPLSPA